MNELIEQACEIVYEGITGKCWHKIVIDERDDYDRGLVSYKCSKCDKKRTLSRALTNPSLATSLDAWREHIWPVMSDEQWVSYEEWLCVAIDPNGPPASPIRAIVQASPMHHLIAALRAIGEDELAEKVRTECKS